MIGRNFGRKDEQLMLILLGTIRKQRNAKRNIEQLPTFHFEASNLVIVDIITFKIVQSVVKSKDSLFTLRTNRSVR